MRDDRFEPERAITQNQLALHHQPIFDVSGDALRGVEALVRWKHPRKALVSPQAFLPTAEREGLMHELTAWVLREALLQTRVWREDGLTLNMSVNIAASDLGDPRFLRLLDRTLHVTAGKSAFCAEIRADATADASTAGVRELGSRGIPIALAKLAVERGIGLIAVGIESKTMLGLARDLGCVGAQGYLLAWPMASQELRR